MSYCPLHIHTQYSLLDGAIRLQELIPHLQRYNIKACSITDHSWMAGVVEFQKACIKGDIKPLIGVEAYITHDLDHSETPVKDNYHLVLIAKDNIGYKLLLELVSKAALYNFYHKPRVYREHLKQLVGHVVVLSACLVGEVASKATYELDENGIAQFCYMKDEEYENTIGWYSKVFGDDYYLEIQDWPDDRRYQNTLNQYLIGVGSNNNIKTVITTDAHFLKKEDFELHELLIAMQLKKTLEEYRSSSTMRYGPYFYIKSPQEILESVTNLGVPQAMTNTLEIAEKCNVEIEIGKYKPPVFDIEKSNDYENFLAWKKERYGT